MKLVYASIVAYELYSCGALQIVNYLSKLYQSERIRESVDTLKLNIGNGASYISDIFHQTNKDKM